MVTFVIKLMSVYCLLFFTITAMKRSEIRVDSVVRLHLPTRQNSHSQSLMIQMNNSFAVVLDPYFDEQSVRVQFLGNSSIVVRIEPEYLHRVPTIIMHGHREHWFPGCFKNEPWNHIYAIHSHTLTRETVTQWIFNEALSTPRCIHYYFLGANFGQEHFEEWMGNTFGNDTDLIWNVVHRCIEFGYY